MVMVVLLNWIGYMLPVFRGLGAVQQIATNRNPDCIEK